MKYLSLISCLVLALLLAACTNSDQMLDRTLAVALETTNPTYQKAFAEIDRMPDSPLGYVNLAAIYMKEARRTGDFSLNAIAAGQVAHALELSPNDIPARKLEASLHLAHHRFAEAIDAAEKLRVEIPSDSYIYGVLADAYVEIGNYEKAVETAQKMVDLKPGTASYSRVAQLRSLYGDHQGAVDMFRQAAQATDPNDKETQSWCLVQLGDEYWKVGKFAEAEKIYDEALRNLPGYFLAIVSKGRVRASVGDYASAEELLTDVQSTLPNANAILLLADIYTLRGEKERAARQYEQFDAIQAKLGTAADHKRLVISLADRGKTDEALAMAKNEYATEKSVHSADLMAWALYRAGRASEATPYIREAMRLNTIDARLLFHAGMIAKANGDSSEAKRLLTKALKQNPAFDLIHADEARRAVEVF